jgi:hypothetical protein
VHAVWLRLRSELRARWRAWLGLALLIGLGGGATVAAAGARRTETAYPRFVQVQKGYDLVTGGFPEKIDAQRALRQMAAMPGARGPRRRGRLRRRPAFRAPGVHPGAGGGHRPVGRVGYQLNRFKVVSGRLADRGAPGEAMIPFPTADQQNLEVGSTVRFILGDPDATLRDSPRCTSWGSSPRRGSSRLSALRRTSAACR